MSSVRFSLTELAPLVNPRARSGFYSVYPHRQKWRWFEPFTKRPQGTFDRPTEAASQLLLWWREHFGDDWFRVFQDRLANPSYARQLPPATQEQIWAWDCGPHCPNGAPKIIDGGGYSLVVYVCGDRRVIFPPSVRATRFASRQAAKWYYHAWRRKEYGERESLFILRRSRGGPFKTPESRGLPCSKPQ